MKATTADAYKLFHRGSLALAQVEANGIRIDTQYITETIEKTSKEISKLEKQLKEDNVFRLWKRRFGRKAKLQSRDQLATVIFRDLGYNSKAETDSGKRFKADEAAFADVDLPFVKNYFRLAKLLKTKGTYLEGIASEVQDGFLHPIFNLAGGWGEDARGGAQSYRGSCQLPNFQNIPIRNAEMAELIRRAFISRKGHRLAEIDFSGVEVRIMYCYCKDPVLYKYLTNPTTDMHRDMAMQIFMLDENQVGKKTTRDCSKNMFVFPQFYGSVHFNCARDMWEAMIRRGYTIEGTKVLVQEWLRDQGINKLGECDPEKIKQAGGTKKGTFVDHVKNVEEDFWGNRFKVTNQWRKWWWNEYLRKGYYDMYTGFRVYGTYGRKEVINYPIQGSAFHCLLLSLTKLQTWLTKNKMQTKIIGQIHDSILLDLYGPETQDVLNKIYTIMHEDVQRAWDWITVPLEVEVDVAPKGMSWYDKRPWHQEQGVWKTKA